MNKAIQNKLYGVSQDFFQKEQASEAKKRAHSSRVFFPQSLQKERARWLKPYNLFWMA